MEKIALIIPFKLSINLFQVSHPLYLMLWSFEDKLAIANNITPLEEPWVMEVGDDHFELYLGLTMIQQPRKEINA
jgi:hypothetical protein